MKCDCSTHSDDSHKTHHPNCRLVAERLDSLAKPADPWAHRDVSMRCRTCMWYVPKRELASRSIDPLSTATVGRCRRHAPTMGGYPVVYGSDWCGDHKLDERSA